MFIQSVPCISVKFENLIGCQGHDCAAHCSMCAAAIATFIAAADITPAFFADAV